jgi:NAD-dependent SIR2 family protein deacetylase
MYEQTGTKATEIHSHDCLYCDTIFPQFDDLIKHSRENHPHHCYYCKTTFVLFEEVIKHSTENHGSLMLKVKYLELNPSSGHCGYKSHNFKVIPEKIKALVPVCS